MKKHNQMLMLVSFLFIITGVIALLFNFNCCDLKSWCCYDDSDDEDEVYM